MLMTVKSYAKLNLSLDVLGVREDGYHELSMLMQSVELCDNITVTLTDKPEITVTTDKPYIPAGEGNIAHKAVAAFFMATGKPCGVDIFIEKNIPVGAGLGGGSSNAAAVLLAVNEMLGSPLDIERLMEIGKSVGADVPFCIASTGNPGGCALAGGIGEKLTPITSALDRVTYVLAKPKISIPTASVYKNLDISQITARPDIDAAAKAIVAGDLDSLAKNAANVLEAVVFKRYPQVERIKAQMKNFGAKLALMSGSGSAVFGMFTDRRRAFRAYEYFEETRDFAWIGKSV